MRYLPHSPQDRALMLERIGVQDVDAFFASIPQSARLKTLDLPSHQAELVVERSMAKYARQNMGAGSVPFFCGAGLYHHHVPASVDHLIQRSEFLTSYTPYQPEISQGTLQYLFEFQTQVARLTGMDVANASMYDGSTATLEAVMMAHRITKRRKTVLATGLHPHYAQVIKDMARMVGVQGDKPENKQEVLHDFAPDTPRGAFNSAALIAQLDADTSCVVVQSPDVFGRIIDLREIAQAAQALGIIVISVVNEVLSLGALASPGAQGADVVVGEGQSLGNGLNFGGPTVGLFATRQKYLRQMPGRLCGETVDATGERGFVLTLSTREQHIRRNKATSNICTNSGLCALAFSIHCSLLGGHGLHRLAQLNHARALDVMAALNAIDGVNVINDTFFNEFCVELPVAAAGVVEALAEKSILGGVPLSRLYPDMPQFANLLLVAATELTMEDDIAAFASALTEVLHG